MLTKVRQFLNFPILFLSNYHIKLVMHSIKIHIYSYYCVKLRSCLVVSKMNKLSHVSMNSDPSKSINPRMRKATGFTRLVEIQLLVSL